MIEKLTFLQGVLAGIVISVKNISDPEFQAIKNNSYLTTTERERLLKEKYFSGTIQDCKHFDDLLKILAGESTKQN